MAFLGERVLACARTYLGVPWKHRGRDRSGVDCAGLALAVAWELKLPDIPTEIVPYSVDVTSDVLLTYLKRFTYQIPRGEDVLSGDMVVFATGRFAGHLGFMVRDREEPYLLHAVREGPGCVVEHPFTPNWTARISGYYRFKE